MKLDETDKKIIRELQLSGRKSASNIAEKIKVSVPTVTDRIRKLQDSGVILGFQAILNPSAVGLDISAIITVVSGSSKNYKEVTSEAKSTPEITQCFSTTGAGSHKLIVTTKNSTSLEELLRKIQAWPGVVRTETQIILSTYKKRSTIPI
jgi:Lrp/AsnC family leucine-responsive transcriptional regulator